MSDDIYLSASDLGRRYGCTRQNITQYVAKGQFVDADITALSGFRLWREATVVAFEKNDPRGARWAERVRVQE